MQIIENVARYDWWPYRAADSGEASNVSSLWLPVEPAVTGSSRSDHCCRGHDGHRA